MIDTIGLGITEPEEIESAINREIVWTKYMSIAVSDGVYDKDQLYELHEICDYNHKAIKFFDTELYNKLRETIVMLQQDILIAISEIK
jgi:hypothetical protein